MSDLFDLQRFLVAQDDHDMYGTALRELRGGRKQSHWMWFIFPQVAGLGRSPTAQHFAITGMSEAQAYLAHPVLGPRLVESARVLTELSGTDPDEVFGPIDAQKLRSSMTLFGRAASQQLVFQEVLDQYFGGKGDQATLSRL